RTARSRRALPRFGSALLLLLLLLLLGGDRAGRAPLGGGRRPQAGAAPGALQGRRTVGHVLAAGQGPGVLGAAALAGVDDHAAPGQGAPAQPDDATCFQTSSPIRLRASSRSSS